MGAETTEPNGEHAAREGRSDEPRAEDVVDAIQRASRALIAITARSLASVNEDVTLPQFRTLVVLATRGPQTVSALAEHLAVHASTMTRMCNRLVRRGLVHRAPSEIDRREVVIVLSESGSRVVDDVTRSRRHEIETIVGRMSNRDRAATIDALTKFAVAAGVDAAIPAHERTFAFDDER